MGGEGLRPLPLRIGRKRMRPLGYEACRKLTGDLYSALIGIHPSNARTDPTTTGTLRRHRLRRPWADIQNPRSLPGQASSKGGDGQPGRSEKRQTVTDNLYLYTDAAMLQKETAVASYYTSHTRSVHFLTHGKHLFRKGERTAILRPFSMLWKN